jgi:hypothetical protein
VIILCVFKRLLLILYNRPIKSIVIAAGMLAILDLNIDIAGVMVIAHHSILLLAIH